MNLLKETASFWTWFYQVIRTFLLVSPWTTLLVILMAAFSRITSLLAFFLPLKVLLLAGSPGVPRYFQFFIEPDQKMGWIIGLIFGAIACYITTIILERLTERFSLAGSEQVLKQARVIPVLTNQQEVAQNYYTKFCQIASDTLFMVVGLLVGLLLNFWVFVFFIGLVAVLFLLTLFLARDVDHVQPARAGVYIRDNLKGYVKVLASVVFLSSFIVLLLPFLLTEYSNILVAILSFLIIRQVLKSQTSIAKEAVSLSEARHEINALIFPDEQFTEKESLEDKAFAQIFYKSSRQRLVEQELGRTMSLFGPLDVVWKDPVIPGIYTFGITVQSNPENNERHFLHQVFPFKQFQKLEHENFLFKHISRSRLKAPRVVTVFFAGPFQCRIIESGHHEHIPASKWPKLQKTLIQHVWSCQPSIELVHAYRSSTLLLHQRLSDNFCLQMQFAVDNDAEKEKLTRFMDNLPLIRERLHKMPLHIHNPDLDRNNVFLAQDNEVLIMTWCRWALEPMGAGMPSSLKENDLAQIIENIGSSRNDVSEDFCLEDVLLASRCHQLEKIIKNKRYKAALVLVDKIHGS